MRRGQRRRPLWRIGALLAATLGSACATPPPGAAPNPLIGSWATAGGDVVTLRSDTVVQNEPDGRRIVLGRDSCAGRFGFGYASATREQLSGLITRQPALHQELAGLLTAPRYPVARLDCDRGDETYVLLGPDRLVAVYRDDGIAAVERLTRR